MQRIITGLFDGLLGRRRTQAARASDRFDRTLANSALTFQSWIADVYAVPRIYVTPRQDLTRQLPAAMREAAAATLAAADRILEHQFDLLGSGPFVPIDPDRAGGVNPDRAGSMNPYQPIDWTLDPVRNLRFPAGFPHGAWNADTMRPANADIKYPWELARCQHWPVLGQAWLMTRKPAYALEIANELDDFMAANPVGAGIHWVCTMDVALRALNWAIALELVRDCTSLDDTFPHRAYRHLFDHGVFIFANLENRYEVTSNHFLSNVVGLYYLSAVFRELEEGRTWNTFCRGALEREMDIQVLPDGADFESSIPYHRLVTELFLGAARLAAFRDEALSPAYHEKLRAMVAFLADTLRPDGLMPQIGDADDGRLHVLSGYGTWRPQDPRHLFGPAALILNEPAWLKHAGPAGAWESEWWGFDTAGVTFACNQLPPRSKLFPHAGIAVSRRDDQYLLVSNGIVGTKGFGNHKHNDQLGFELCLDGAPLIVDPGSFVYTSDPDARNRFRSTAYHNTLRIDGEEQNEIRPEWLFRLFETARAEHLHFIADDGTVEYRGRHVGYGRLSRGGLTHERRFRLAHAERMLIISDILEGNGQHDLRWHFHLAPGVSASIPRTGICRLETMGRRYVLASVEALEAEVGDAWYSPSYGVRQPCRAVDFIREATVEGRSRWGFAIAPEATFDPEAARLAHATLVAAP